MQSQGTLSGTLLSRGVSGRSYIWAPIRVHRDSCVTLARQGGNFANRDTDFCGRLLSSVGGSWLDGFLTCPICLRVFYRIRTSEISPVSDSSGSRRLCHVHGLQLISPWRASASTTRDTTAVSSHEAFPPRQEEEKNNTHSFTPPKHSNPVRCTSVCNLACVFVSFLMRTVSS